MSKTFRKILDFFGLVHDKPINENPISVEPGEIAEPSSLEPFSGSGVASAAGVDSTSAVGLESSLAIPLDSASALGPDTLSALRPDSSSVADCLSALCESSDVAADPRLSPEKLPNLDPLLEKQRNKQYKAGLSSAAMWFETRFKANLCPKEQLSNFDILGKLGNGGHGHVFKVKYHKDEQIYALEVQDKRVVVKKTSIAGAIREKKIMLATQSEFVVKLYFAFKDARNLYLVTDYASRGDLSQLIGRNLPERAVKLFTAQMVLGIEYLHACKIAHRDIKAKNISIYDDLYVKIGDFGLAKNFPLRAYTSLGTPHYMAPEMFKQKGYRVGIDWWAMGIVLYRLVYTRHPYAELHFDTQQVMASLQNMTLGFPAEVYPNSEVNGLLRGLLEKNVIRRLGMMQGGSDDIKQHEWFSDVSFCDLAKKTVRIPLRLDTVYAEVLEKYDFIPDKNEEDFKPNFFKDF